MGQNGDMEKTDRQKQSTTQFTRSVCVEQRRVGPVPESGQPKPLTGRAGAMAAVVRLYDEHGDELKQLADA